MKICLICESKFVPKTLESKYCSGKCSCRAYYLRNRTKEQKRLLSKYYQLKKTNYGRLREINLKATRKYKSSHKEEIKIRNKDYQNRTKQSLKYHNQRYFGGNKEKILALYCNQCAICSTNKSLVVHHIDGSGHSKVINNEMSNLILLCRGCHARVHCKGKLIHQDIVRTYVKA